MADDIGVQLLHAQPQSRARFILRDGKPRRWPLSFAETLRLVPVFFRFLFCKKSLAPKQEESIASWGDAKLSLAVRSRLLAPALQGIYAGDASRLSASLILGRFFSQQQKQAKSTFRGSVSPKQGMSEFTERLETYLRKNGVIFQLQTEYKLLNASEQDVVLCCPPRASAAVLEKNFPDIASQLRQIEMLSVASITCFFPPNTKSLPGFGCLFPRGEKIRALGLLVNHEIFENRGDASETWIMGGATDPTILDLSDEELLKIVYQDRELLLKEKALAIETKIHRWPVGIPHYSIDLEKILPTLKLPPGVHLFGNYLGNLGLTKILAAASALPEKLQHE
jgi:oxygen-dependent protoporphyrinogen oxidase